MVRHIIESEEESEGILTKDPTPGEDEDAEGEDEMDVDVDVEEDEDAEGEPNENVDVDGEDGPEVRTWVTGLVIPIPVLTPTSCVSPETSLRFSSPYRRTQT